MENSVYGQSQPVKRQEFDNQQQVLLVWGQKSQQIDLTLKQNFWFTDNIFHLSEVQPLYKLSPQVRHIINESCQFVAQFHPSNILSDLQSQLRENKYGINLTFSCASGKAYLLLANSQNKQYNELRDDMIGIVEINASSYLKNQQIKSIEHEYNRKQQHLNQIDIGQVDQDYIKLQAQLEFMQNQVQEIEKQRQETIEDIQNTSESTQQIALQYQDFIKQNRTLYKQWLKEFQELSELHNFDQSAKVKQFNEHYLLKIKQKNERDIKLKQDELQNTIENRSQAQSQQENLCIYCKKQQRNIIIRKCGHLLFCDQCAETQNYPLRTNILHMGILCPWKHCSKIIKALYKIN